MTQLEILKLAEMGLYRLIDREEILKKRTNGSIAEKRMPMLHEKLDEVNRLILEEENQGMGGKRR